MLLAMAGQPLPAVHRVFPSREQPSLLGEPAQLFETRKRMDDCRTCHGPTQAVGLATLCLKLMPCD